MTSPLGQALGSRHQLSFQEQPIRPVCFHSDEGTVFPERGLDQPHVQLLQTRCLPEPPTSSPGRFSCFLSLCNHRPSNPGLVHCRQTLYLLSHQGSLMVSKGGKLEGGRRAKLGWVFHWLPPFRRVWMCRDSQWPVSFPVRRQPSVLCSSCPSFHLCLPVWCSHGFVLALVPKKLLCPF